MQKLPDESPRRIRIQHETSYNRTRWKKTFWAAVPQVSRNRNMLKQRAVWRLILEVYWPLAQSGLFVLPDIATFKELLDSDDEIRSQLYSLHGRVPVRQASDIYFKCGSGGSRMCMQCKASVIVCNNRLAVADAPIFLTLRHSMNYMATRPDLHNCM